LSIRVSPHSDADADDDASLLRGTPATYDGAPILATLGAVAQGRFVDSKVDKKVDKASLGATGAVYWRYSFH
jgi:hypothetical protein